MYKFLLLIFLFILTTGCSAEKNNYPQLLTSSLINRIEFAANSEGQFCIYDGNKYTFLNEIGKDITPYLYDYAYPFNEGLACVYRDGKYGFIDKKGNQVLPFVYDKANPFNEGLAYFEIGDKYGFIDKGGNEVFLLNCDSVSSFKEGLAFFSINGKYGYINKMGREIIPPIYDDGGYFQNGIAKIRLGDKIGVIDKNGNEIVPIKYDDVNINNGFIITESNNKYGCYNNRGKVILPSEYDSIFNKKDDKNIVFKIEEKYGIADENGNIVITATYDGIEIIPKTNLLIIKLNDKYGISDYNGIVQVPIKYEYISIIYNSEYTKEMVQVRLNKKVGFLSLSDYSEVIPLIYDSALYFTKERIAVKLDGKYGVINRKGKVVIPFDYEEIKIFDNGMILKKNGKFSLTDNNGKILTKKLYDDIKTTKSSFEVRINNKYGFINKNGEEIIPPIYDYISDSKFYPSYRGCYIATKYDYNIGNRIPNISSSIIKTGDNQDSDLSELLLKNEITPKIKLFHDYIKNGHVTIPFFERRNDPITFDKLKNFIKTFKLYDVDGSGKPILYFYAKPIVRLGEAYSGLFSIKDNQINELLTGYVSGGTIGGNYICFYKDKETSKIAVGTERYTGGFGGRATSSDFYNCGNGEVAKITSCYWIGQTIKNYNDESVLLENVNLFYDENNIPYNKDTILKAEYVAKYLVDDKQSTFDYFSKVMKRFKKIHLRL